MNEGVNQWTYELLNEGVNQWTQGHERMIKWCIELANKRTNKEMKIRTNEWTKVILFLLPVVVNSISLKWEWRQVRHRLRMMITRGKLIRTEQNRKEEEEQYGVRWVISLGRSLAQEARSDKNQVSYTQESIASDLWNAFGYLQL